MNTEQLKELKLSNSYIWKNLAIVLFWGIIFTFYNVVVAEQQSTFVHNLAYMVMGLAAGRPLGGALEKIGMKKRLIKTKEQV